MGTAPRTASSGKRKKVLWTNPNPSASSFSAQSITIDGLSKYKSVYCEFVTDSNNLSMRSTCLLEDSFSLAIRNAPATATGWRLRTGERSGNTIKFDHGFYYDSTATGAQHYNTICIPYQIYALI